MTKIIHVEGMGCQNCVKHVTEALEALEGVEKADVKLETNTATVTLKTEVSNEVLKSLLKSVEDAGYDVSKID